MWTITTLYDFFFPFHLTVYPLIRKFWISFYLLYYSATDDYQHDVPLFNAFVTVFLWITFRYFPQSQAFHLFFFFFDLILVSFIQVGSRMIDLPGSSNFILSLMRMIDSKQSWCTIMISFIYYLQVKFWLHSSTFCPSENIRTIGAFRGIFKIWGPSYVFKKSAVMTSWATIPIFGFWQITRYNSENTAE